MIISKYSTFAICFLHVLTTNCQQVPTQVVKPRFEVKFELGGIFFTNSHDTTSYLPNELFVEGTEILFTPKFSRSLIKYNTSSQVADLFDDIPKNIENYMPTRTSTLDIRQWWRTLQSASILFGDHLFTFDRETQTLTQDISLSNFSYFIPKPDGGFFTISESGVLYNYSQDGIMVKSTKLKNFSSGYLARSENAVYCSNSISVFRLDIDSLENGSTYRCQLFFNNEEKQNYVLMAASDKYLIWCDITDINKIILTDVLSGKISRKIDIDPAILDDKEVTKIPVVHGPSVDPPEPRQYVRLAAVDQRIYLMFQSKGFVYLFSFEV